MPERGEASGEDVVFKGLLTENIINKYIKEWFKTAGIGQKKTFHSSRHTFGTMLRTLGVDHYTVIKLMGHSKVETTQIYAKIINKKKDDAIGLIDKAFEDTMDSQNRLYVAKKSR